MEIALPIMILWVAGLIAYLIYLNTAIGLITLGMVVPGLIVAITGLRDIRRIAREIHRDAEMKP